MGQNDMNELIELRNKVKQQDGGSNNMFGGILNKNNSMNVNK